MIAANQALYDVIVKDVDSVGTEKQGEMILSLEAGEDQPPLDQLWLVTPVKPTEGTNQFGASISVPTVEFVRIATPEDFRVHTAPQQ